MHVDAELVKDKSAFATDVCIVGAGAAGITIAKAFKNSRIEVMLLESGGLEYEHETQSLYEGEITGLPYRPLTAARLRYFGGTTGHWSGWCAPLDPIDFAQRDWIPHSGWPISYGDLEPWYRRAQDICQLGPFEYQAEYWEEKSALRRLQLSPDTVSTKILQFSPPTRFGSVYRQEITDSANISLCTHANITNIQTNATASHVTGIEASTLGHKKIAVRAKQYVLAMGGMENPRVLLLSNDVIPQGLGNQNGLVGRYFMEHPAIETSSMMLSDERTVEFHFYRDERSFLPLFGITPAAQKAKQIGNYSSILWSRKVMEGSRGGTIFPMDARIEQVPNPNSRITLDADKKDALGQPKIRFHWQLSEFDKRTIRVAEQLIANQLGRLQIGRLQMPDWLVAEDNAWPSVLRGPCHHMGTTRMSVSPKAGVVNADCRVHGIDNLYIAGSSVFPTAGTANPTMTIVALASRLASHLRNKASA